MYDNQTKQQTATIYYNAPRPVEIGNVFYRIECGKRLYFREPCRVCGGKRELTINGVTFRCPCCDNENTTINVAPYLVRRYRVNEIRETANDYDWKLGDRYVWYRLYRKIGHGHYTYGEEGGSFEMRADEFSRKYNAPYEGGEPQASFGIYDDYKLAVSIAEKMTAYEINQLQEYNAKFGSEHEAVFTQAHDPKSK